MKKGILSGFYGENAIIEDVGGYEIVRATRSIDEEYNILRGGVAVFDYSNFGLFKISGSDACSFLQELATRDIEFLVPEKSRMCLLLDDDANIMSLVTILNFEDYYYLATWPEYTQKTWDWLNSNITDSVTVENLTGVRGVIGLEGPKSWEIIQEIIDIEISALPFLGFVETEWNGVNTVVARIGYAGEYGYIIFIDESHAAELWETLFELGKDKNIGLCGKDVLTVCMLEVRQPNIIEEILPDANLFESKLQWFIDFSKSQYKGYEALMKMKDTPPANCIIGFSADFASDIQKDDTVYVENDKIGRIINCYKSLKMGKKLGLAFVDSKFAYSGIPLAVTKNNIEAEINTISAPYIIPESWITKMI